MDSPPAVKTSDWAVNGWPDGRVVYPPPEMLKKTSDAKREVARLSRALEEWREVALVKRHKAWLLSGKVDPNG